MATEQEIQEARDFIESHNDEWVSNDMLERECPTIAERREDESWPIAYDFNEVCGEAFIPGGIEEHGYSDWLVTDTDDE